MTHIRSRPWLLDRRHLLRGLGATLGLPWLECMRPARERPARAVFVYLPNGVNMLDWQVARAGRDWEPNTSLAPLARHRDALTLFSGLHHPHGLRLAHRCDKIWLTGAEIVQGSAERPNTLSVDQRIAQETGVHTRFPSLELALVKGTLAWSPSGVPLPAERSVRAAFERLFGRDTGGKDAARRRLRRRGSVLDAVKRDAEALRRELGVRDRLELDEYLEAVREVEVRVERADAWLDVPRPEVGPEDRARLTRGSLGDEGTGALLDAFFELTALALRTDMTRVVTLLAGSENLAPPIPELGIQQTRHELSHHGGNPEQMEKLSRTDAFHCERLAGFLDRLAASEEDGERLLDRTQVLFGSGMSYGHSHGNANLPILLAGGRALGLVHGRHLDMNLPCIGAYDLTDTKAYYSLCLRPADESARLSNLLLTMLQCMGIRDEAFADSTGPIAELVG